MEEPSKKTISTAILTIETVSAKDFQAEFKCAGKGLYTTNYATLSLKKRGPWRDCSLLSIWDFIGIRLHGQHLLAEMIDRWF